MVTLESAAEQDLALESRHTIREFQLTVRWVTDEEARHWLDDEEWGNLILALALLGKLQFIDDRLKTADGAWTRHPNDQAAFTEAHGVWQAYRERSGEAFEARLQHQFDITVRRRLLALLDWRQPKDPADFAAYLLERDTVQFFLMGCELEGVGERFRALIAAIDARMRDVLNLAVLPELRRKLSPNPLARVHHPLLPDMFWWRTCSR